MIRGSTPTHYFTVPCDGENIAKLNIYYAQDDVLLFKKTKSDCNIEGSTITVKLTRSESLLFNHKKAAQVQVVVQLISGDVLVSLVETVGVSKLLYDGVIE